MPELPEVDLVARQLQRLLKGRTIETAKLIRARLAPSTTPAVFSRRLRDSTFTEVRRRGKYILIEFDISHTLLVHLRMSGRFMLLDEEDENPKFAHAVFQLTDGQRLVFDDQRHFGLMKIVKTNEIASSPEIAKLAPEPFSEEFTVDQFHRSLKAARRTLKEFLLDQTKVTGLGNIYAAEVMYAAGVHPSVKANRISRPRAERLFSAIELTLRQALKMSKRGKLDPRNINGNYAPENGRWLVYGREGKPCETCSNMIKRITHAGRSTYFCPVCQRR
ncbi:MAG TPA: bifunctional DNA-formamidopyrimidine glycosylase/DNA-(apurinic or apyrimidinic site) lyase [Pyrinomonadaceae bacterium]|nr:bifunctional DNA-formamidopyrimidine glycosylase/DNA-(apurinic or apyrimidinic site) lyase [Pyrinomonadaceae bacterium]